MEGNLSQVNQAVVKGLLEIFLNLRTHSKEARPRKIIIDSIRMNLYWQQSITKTKNKK